MMILLDNSKLLKLLTLEMPEIFPNILKLQIR